MDQDGGGLAESAAGLSEEDIAAFAAELDQAEQSRQQIRQFTADYRTRLRDFARRYGVRAGERRAFRPVHHAQS